MENIDYSRKLKAFENLVLKDVEDKSAEIVEQAQNEYDKRIDEKETEFLEQAYHSIQENIHSVRRDANEKIIHTELNSKKKLIVKREEIIEDVMKKARERLAEFTKSEAYEKWLLNKIKKAVSELGEGSKTVYITPSDARLKDKIEALSDGITVRELSERGFFGGVKVTNTDKRISADYSFSEMLDEQRKKFLTESGLTLDVSL